MRTLAILVSVSMLHAQVSWSSFVGRAEHAIAYDVAHQQLVLHGGRDSNAALLDDTWTLATGGAWTQPASAAGLSGLYQHSMAYAANGRVVSFGGLRPPGAVNEMWEWDGNAWTFLRPLTPPARSGHRMVFDPVRNVTVLFGGRNGTTFFGDTWEWNGSSWSPRSPAVHPSARAYHAMTYDSRRQAVVLHGGWTGGNGGAANPDDVWSWDGTNWQSIGVLTPSRRLRHGMAFDSARQQLVVFGGIDRGDVPGQVLDDTWVGDGVTWSQVNPASRPAVRVDHAMTSVAGTVTLQGGSVDAGGLARRADTWTWDGTNWTQVTSAAPGERRDAAMACDEVRGQVLLFGGVDGAGALGDTWLLQSGAWSRVLGSAPARRSRHALAEDRGRGRVVMFGGVDVSSVSLSDTWEWDGTTWTALTPGQSPSAREGHAMCFDAITRRTLLFGGSPTPAGALNDCWAWDGTTWQQLSVGVSPVARRGAAMVFDRRRNRVLLFGGKYGGGGGVLLGDTWEFDGTAWSQRQPTSSPPPRSGHRMVFDTARGSIVLFGGATGNGSYLSDLWQWDGSNWTQLLPALFPSPRDGCAMAYDPVAARTVVFGGAVQGTTLTNELWTLAAQHPATTRNFGATCPGSAGTPALTAPPPDAPWALPWLGDTARFALTGVPSGTIAFLIVGFSTQSWNGVPLPLPLTGAGLIGCTLYTEMAVLVPAVTTVGAATFGVPIPAGSDLLDARFYTQALTLDPAANPFGATLSGAIEARIGSR